MKFKYKQLLVVLFVALVFWQVGGCTRATKDSSDKSQIKLQLPEKIKVISGKVQTSSMPDGYTLGHVGVTVTGPDMEEMTTQSECFGEACQISNVVAMEIPMGSARSFQVVAAYSNTSASYILYGVRTADINKAEMPLDISTENFALQTETKDTVGNVTIQWSVNNLVTNPMGITALDVYYLSSPGINVDLYRNAQGGFLCESLSLMGFNLKSVAAGSSDSISILSVDAPNSAVVACPKAGERYLSRLAGSTWHYSISNIDSSVRLRAVVRSTGEIEGYETSSFVTWASLPTVESIFPSSTSAFAGNANSTSEVGYNLSPLGNFPPYVRSITYKVDALSPQYYYYGLVGEGQVVAIDTGSLVPVPLVDGTTCPFRTCTVPAWMQSISAGAGDKIFGLDHGGSIYEMSSSSVITEVLSITQVPETATFVVYY